MVVYADDIALYQIIQSPEDYLLVQYDINAVLEWATANDLTFNYRHLPLLPSCFFTKKILPVTPVEINGNNYC